MIVMKFMDGPYKGTEIVGAIPPPTYSMLCQEGMAMYKRMGELPVLDGSDQTIEYRLERIDTVRDGFFRSTNNGQIEHSG